MTDPKESEMDARRRAFEKGVECGHLSAVTFVRDVLHDPVLAKQLEVALNALFSTEPNQVAVDRLNAIAKEGNN